MSKTGSNKIKVRLRDRGSRLKGKPIAIHGEQVKEVEDSQPIRNLIKMRVLVIVEPLKKVIPDTKSEADGK